MITYGQIAGLFAPENLGGLAYSVSSLMVVFRELSPICPPRTTNPDPCHVGGVALVGDAPPLDHQDKAIFGCFGR
jgi:hypothetical protein